MDIREQITEEIQKTFSRSLERVLKRVLDDCEAEELEIRCSIQAGRGWAFSIYRGHHELAEVWAEMDRETGEFKVLSY